MTNFLVTARGLMTAYCYTLTVSSSIDVDVSLRTDAYVGALSVQTVSFSTESHCSGTL